MQVWLHFNSQAYKGKDRMGYSQRNNCKKSEIFHLKLFRNHFRFSSVQLLSCVRIFVTPWTTARQASPSITNSQKLLKLMSIELVMQSNHFILCHPLLLSPSIFPSIRVFSTSDKPFIYIKMNTIYFHFARYLMKIFYKPGSVFSIRHMKINKNKFLPSSNLGSHWDWR